LIFIYEGRLSYGYGYFFILYFVLSYDYEINFINMSGDATAKEKSDKE